MKEFREKYKETIKRAIRTFVQAAIGYVAAHLLYVLPEGANADTMKKRLYGRDCVRYRGRSCRRYESAERVGQHPDDHAARRRTDAAGRA